ncbi:hypothetical protein U9M48_036433 [Paspalum notatum var. saurae]|uniref:Uncharacterized protein n=1 Tax=Paspalum notatum var. saurae TaxID=547442 RepID=A0AAQ3X8Y5_PASNO
MKGTAEEAAPMIPDDIQGCSPTTQRVLPSSLIISPGHRHVLRCSPSNPNPRFNDQVINFGHLFGDHLDFTHLAAYHPCRGSDFNHMAMSPTAKCICHDICFAWMVVDLQGA